MMVDSDSLVNTARPTRQRQRTVQAERGVAKIRPRFERQRARALRLKERDSLSRGRGVADRGDFVNEIVLGKVSLASAWGIINLPSDLGRGSQVVRHGSAKAAFVGSIPTLASNSKLRLDKGLQISQTQSASKVPAKM